MFKIGHVGQRYLPVLPPSGSERYMRELSEGLASKGHKVTVLTSNAYDYSFLNPFMKRFNKRSDKIGNVQLLRFPIYKIVASLRIIRNLLIKTKLRNDFINLITSGPFIPNLYYHLKHSDYEVVHATPFPYSITWLAWLATRKSKTPFVITPLFHPTMLQYYNPYLINVLKNSEAIIALTNIERKLLIRLGAVPNRVYVVPLGINIADYASADGDRFRRKYGLESYHLILCLSKRQEKGAIHLLRAMSIVQKHLPNAMLVAVGERTREWIAEKNRVNTILIDREAFIDENEKKDAFDACDVFVMPSKVDSYGYVYLEAWARAKPVIGARIGAIPEVIRNGVNGLLVEFGNVNQLVEAITKLIKNSKLRSELGINGKSRISKYNNIKNVIRKVESIYEIII